MQNILIRIGNRFVFIPLYFNKFEQGGFCCDPILMAYAMTSTLYSSFNFIVLSRSDTSLIHPFIECWWIPYFIILAAAPLLLNHADYSPVFFVCFFSGAVIEMCYAYRHYAALWYFHYRWCVTGMPSQWRRWKKRELVIIYPLPTLHVSSWVAITNWLVSVVSLLEKYSWVIW